MTSIEAKERGAAAWIAQDFNLAITHFSTAIEIGGDKDFLKVVYSNRSAANLKLNKLKEALSDANKCIELDRNWSKGYTRKGDALFSSVKYSDANDAYNSAKKLSPADESITAKCELSRKAIRTEADRKSGSSSSDSEPTSLAAAKPFEKVVIIFRYLLLLSGFLYFVPLGSTYSFICYSLYAVLGLLIGVFTLYNRLGFPKFNLDYAERAMQDTTFVYLFISLFMLTTRQYILMMAPIFLVQVSYLSTIIFEFGRLNIAALESQIKPIITRFIPSAADENLGLLFSPANETHFKTALRKNAALTEVMQGIFLLIELLLPTRNTLLMFIWWQYLQMRYMGDKTGDLREAFRSLDEKILSLLSHRLCPKILTRLYVMLTKVLADKVKPPPPHTGPPPTMSTVFSHMVSGLKPKCSIM